MRMEVHLQQRMEQRMHLSQQMLQNLELLQLPLLQLRQKIDEELEANPILEIASELEERVPEVVQPDKPAAETAVEESKREFLESVEEEWFQSERKISRGSSAVGSAPAAARRCAASGRTRGRRTAPGSCAACRGPALLRLSRRS